jgi:hypothetical protein
MFLEKRGEEFEKTASSSTFPDEYKQPLRREAYLFDGYARIHSCW